MVPLIFTPTIVQGFHYILCGSLLLTANYLANLIIVLYSPLKLLLPILWISRILLTSQSLKEMSPWKHLELEFYVHNLPELFNLSANPQVEVNDNLLSKGTVLEPTLPEGKSR